MYRHSVDGTYEEAVVYQLVMVIPTRHNRVPKNHVVDPDVEGRTCCGQFVWAEDRVLGRGTNVSCGRCKISPRAGEWGKSSE